MVTTVDALTVNALARPFAAATPTDPWFHIRMGSYASTDGRVTPVAGGGLHVAPPATNRRTGAPAFGLSLAPESKNGGIPAVNDHAKWLAYFNQHSASGFPGVDAPPGTRVSGHARLTVRTFGTEFHPFGAAVRDAQADPRLAAFAITSIDVESWMVFDFFFTNRRVYAIYERLPFGRTDMRPYAAFTYAVPVAERTPDDWHAATIAYDAAAGSVGWTLDGAEVFRVTRLGQHLASREHLVIDLGGEEQLQRPRQLAFGMGLFTLLDGALGSGPGLVRLSDVSRYCAPHAADGAALPFVDEESRAGSRLFGEGAELSIASYLIAREPAVGDPLRA
jgi:hypothetical protein